MKAGMRAGIGASMLLLPHRLASLVEVLGLWTTKPGHVALRWAERRQGRKQEGKEVKSVLRGCAPLTHAFGSGILVVPSRDDVHQDCTPWISGESGKWFRKSVRRKNAQGRSHTSCYLLYVLLTQRNSHAIAADGAGVGDGGFTVHKAPPGHFDAQ